MCLRSGHGCERLPTPRAVVGSRSGIDPRFEDLNHSRKNNSRPGVAVILPFAGTRAAAERSLAALAAIELGDHDEVVVLDNQPGRAVPGSSEPRFSVVADSSERSSYYARNRGAEVASAEWLLFVDADCRPAPSILDEYFAEPIADGCAILAGGVIAAVGQQGFAARYARDRGHVSETFHVAGFSDVPAAGITANLLVRRAALEQVGGFHEGVFSGADVEFCWRVQDAGWTLVHRPSAKVEHEHAPTIAAALRKCRRYGAGRCWVNRRYPGRAPRPRLARELIRSVAGFFVWMIALQPRRAVYKLLDGLWAIEQTRGFALGDNRSTRESPPRPGPALIAECFPSSSSTRSAATAEAAVRPSCTDRSLARAVHASYAEDDPPLERCVAFARLCKRRPLAVLRDAFRSRRGRGPSLLEMAPQAVRLEREGREVLVDEGAQRRAVRLMRLSGLSPAHNINRR